MTVVNDWRKTTQDLAPLTHTSTPRGQYDLYPGFSVGAGKIDVGFDALAAKLTTASKTGTPNPVVIAVLGLYLQGGSRREIARRLGVSEATVRNYVGVVYGVFGIGSVGFDSTGARMQVLWNQCVALGFVASTAV